jgi:excisionase family DNA binding protein
MQRNAGISNESLLNKKDVAARLRICRRTLDYWIKDGTIPHIKIGGAVRFVPSDIDDLIASRRIGSTHIKGPLVIATTGGGQ